MLPRRTCLCLIMFCTCPPLCAGALWPMPTWVWRNVRSVFLLLHETKFVHRHDAAKRSIITAIVIAACMQDTARVRGRIALDAGSCFVRFALLLLLCWVDRCFYSWVMLGLFCLLRVTPTCTMYTPACDSSSLLSHSGRNQARNQ